MATNVSIRALMRGTPQVRIKGTTLSYTVDHIFDLDDPVVKRDLHHYLGQWIVSAAGSPTIAVGTDPGAIGGASLDTQTGGGSVTAIDTQTGASTSAITASSNDADGAKLSLAQALQVDYNKTVEDVTDLYDTVGTLATDYTKTVEDVTDLYATVAYLVTAVADIRAAMVANGWLV